MEKQENFESYNETLSYDRIIPSETNTPDDSKINLNLNATKNDNNILLKKNIQYGIDENGNPINIKEYYKSINDSVNLNSNTSMFSGITNITQRLKKPIAYIIKDDNNNNILVDLKGNKITTKNKDGDYDFPLQLHVVIKDFDVQHPELRINGERYYKDILEDIDIAKEIHDSEKENESLKANNCNDGLVNNKYNMNNINNGLPKEDNNFFLNNKKVVYRDNINTYKYYTNNNNINLNENDNKVVSRTSNILNNSNSQNSGSLKKYINNHIQKYGNRSKGKRKYFMGNGIKNNISKCMGRDLTDSNKEYNSYKMKTNKSALNFSVMNPNFFNQKYEISNNKEFLNSKSNRTNMFNEILNTDIYNNNNSNNCKINFISPKIKKPGRNKKIINILKNDGLVTSSQMDKYYKNINNNDNSFHNYFVIKQNKSFTNSKLIKKRDNNGKESLIKKIKKNSYFIPKFGKLKTTNNNNNSNINKNSKKKIINKKHINSCNNSFIKNENKELSKRVKKIENIPKKLKIIHLGQQAQKLINSRTNKYNVLSEEANNMIKSYSKKNVNNENQNLNKKIEYRDTQKNKYEKYNKIDANNSNSFIPSSVQKIIKIKNIKKEYCQKQSGENINQKYLGITLSLPNNENNKNKKIRTNNQININFTPYQIQCESLIKNNSSNNYCDINKINEKRNVNKLKSKKRYNDENTFISPNYEICL